jgi:alanine dehydrogenase
MRRFSSRPLGQANGQDDLTIRLLLLRLCLDTRTADELEAVVHAVQEQPHIPHDELADAALRRLLRVLFREIGVDIRLRLCHVELLADDKQRCPVLNVISEIEGTASITIASELLSNTQGGKGILLGGIPGVSPTEVVVIGAGNAGTVATRAAMALGASVKVFDDDINKLRTIQQVLGQGLFTSTFHPNVLQNAFRSADVVIGAMRYINTRHRYIIAEDMIRIMKRGALVIDLRINQGGCFETTCCLCPSDPAVFEQYGVLHYCRQNISNRVARTTSMALSNIFVPMLFQLGDTGAVQGMIKSDPGFKNGVYMYCGKPVNNYVSNRFGLSSNNIDLYLSAF